MAFTPAKEKILRRKFQKTPFAQNLGIKILKLKPGYAELSLAYQKRITQPYGFMHGGAIAALADTVAATAIHTLLEPEDKMVSIEMKVNYLAPVTKGKIKACAKVIHKGRKTAVTDVEIKDEKGELCAKSIVTYMLFPGGKIQ
ncbi:MAG: hypothetical protein A2145_04210 [candidate division Zixibacteria bacterium RBG_16_40_9]|nr:MAG: hypothetical protein A2145_04210 [candidate division Zixibacteria bacterium RBG_16_40_9]